MKADSNKSFRLTDQTVTLAAATRSCCDRSSRLAIRSCDPPVQLLLQRLQPGVDRHLLAPADGLLGGSGGVRFRGLVQGQRLLGGQRLLVGLRPLSLWSWGRRHRVRGHFWLLLRRPLWEEAPTSWKSADLLPPASFWASSITDGHVSGTGLPPPGQHSFTSTPWLAFYS